MKNIFYLLLLIMACDSNTAEQDLQEAQVDDNKHYIHFQQGFHEDSLLIYNGDSKIYEKMLTTAEEKGYADIFALPEEDIKTPLRFRFVHEDQIVEGTIPLNAKKYIGVYITSGTAVNVHSSDTPFTYPTTNSNR